MDEYLGIVDADSILYRVAATTEDEPLETAKDTLRAFLWNSVYVPTKCQQYVFCLSGGESGRKEIATTKPYKGQRSKDKPKHLADLRKYLEEEYMAFSVDEYEADDVVVAIYEKYRGSSILMGIDKDAKQLAGKHYNYVKQEHFEVSDLESQRFFFKQMLTGDTVDNIPGLPKIGEKKAEDLFNSCVTPPALLVWEKYKELGFDWEYYQEQYRLLRMLRDIVYPFEEHFVDFHGHFEKEVDDEFDF